MLPREVSRSSLGSSQLVAARATSRGTAAHDLAQRSSRLRVLEVGGGVCVGSPGGGPFCPRAGSLRPVEEGLGGSSSPAGLGGETGLRQEDLGSVEEGGHVLPHPQRGSRGSRAGLQEHFALVDSQGSRSLAGPPQDLLWGALRS